MKRTTWLLALAMALTVPAFAQDMGGPPPPGMGGPGMGQRPPRMMMMGGPRILMRQDVQQELKLTGGQITQLREALPGRGPMDGPPPGGGPGMGGPPPGGPGMGGPPPMMDDDRRDAMEAKIKQILDSAQYSRYRQLALQIEGPRAFSRPDIVSKLGLTETQNDRIRTLLDQMRPRGPRPGDDGAPPAPPSFDDMQKRHDEAMKTVLGVLTDSQRQKWSAMVGKPFKFERPQFDRGMGGPRD